MNWYALYTKPRNEKKVAQKLEAMGIQVFCPMVFTIVQWSDRKKKVQKPLLNSYVFVKIDEKSRLNVFQVSGIVRFVYWLGKPAIIKDEEIETLKKHLQEPVDGVLVDSWKPKDKVVISEGMFKNTVGIVQQNTKSQVILLLETLGIKLIIQKQTNSVLKSVGVN